MTAQKKLGRGRKVNSAGRSVGEGRYVRLYHWLLNSAAWDHLSNPAKVLLIEVWKRYNGDNNGEISFSVREAAAQLHIGKNTASGLFHELENKGFLRASERGAFNVKTRLATTWTITALPVGDEPATKDLMRWRPPEKQNTVPDRGTVGTSQRDCDRKTGTKNTATVPP